MKTRIAHFNINITDQEKSLQFYKEALGLHVHNQKHADDGSFVLSYLADETKKVTIELTWLRDHPQKYDLGENESHIAFSVHNMEEAHALHEKMDCIVYENPDMGIYFIVDPDGYWLEIVPES